MGIKKDIDISEATMSLEEGKKLLIIRDDMPQVQTITFVEQGEEIGQLAWDKDGMRFTGNADAAARVFFDEVIRQYTALLRKDI